MNESLGTLATHLSSLVEQRLNKLVKSVKDSQRERSVETVHELRVASRRLRAFVVTFSDGLGHKTRSRLQKKLKRVTKSVAALRDLDVLIELVQTRALGPKSELERAALEYLLETLEQQRAPAAARAETRLEQLDLDGLCDLVRSAVRDVLARLAPDQDPPAYARSLLERRILAAAEQEPPRDGAEHPEQLHRLRIALKELRYALEFLEPLLGEQFALLYARAQALQELLGAYQDFTVLAEVVAERCDDLAHRNRLTLAAGLQLAGAALASERQAVFERVRGRGFEPDWWQHALKRALPPG